MTEAAAAQCNKAVIPLDCFTHDVVPLYVPRAVGLDARLVFAPDELLVGTYEPDAAAAPSEAAAGGHAANTHHHAYYGSRFASTKATSHAALYQNSGGLNDE
jgi:hypothetical protein